MIGNQNPFLTMNWQSNNNLTSIESERYRMIFCWNFNNPKGHLSYPPTTLVIKHYHYFSLAWLCDASRKKIFLIKKNLFFLGFGLKWKNRIDNPNSNFVNGLSVAFKSTKLDWAIVYSNPATPCAYLFIFPIFYSGFDSSVLRRIIPTCSCLFSVNFS